MPEFQHLQHGGVGDVQVLGHGRLRGQEGLVPGLGHHAQLGAVGWFALLLVLLLLPWVAQDKVNWEVEYTRTC